MRHRLAFRKLGRTMEHRKALRRNQAQSLFEHGQITTTLQKAKDLRPFAERMITLAKKARQGDLGARRRLQRLLTERFFIAVEHQDEYDNMSNAGRRAVRRSRSGRHYRTGEGKGSLPFTVTAISHRLINEIAERYEDREGGYTRIIRLAKTRLGDQGAQAILQLVGEEEVPSNVPKPAKSARRRRIDARYAAVLKSGKKGQAAVERPKSEASEGASEPKDSEPAEQAPDSEAKGEASPE
ncbi:MAG: 50S ribosomal protein L17 [Planctomycetota bacterium]|nr:50S ribosomal protein L17 [Planctomycetota bacterium]